MAASELFRSREAQLYIGRDEDSVLMQSGDFALVLVTNAVSHLAAVLAMVGAIQWPVGKDCAVTRTGEARFSFSLPGPLFYTLVLGNSSSAEDLHGLEKILEEYSAFSSLGQHRGAGGKEHESLQDPSKEVAPSSLSGTSNKTSTDELSPEMEVNLQRARRMSAVAKVFSKSLERGTINPGSHVQPMDIVSPGCRTTTLNVALAGVDAVAKVVEAVEMGGRTLLESSGSAVLSDPGSVQGATSDEQSHGGLSGLICSGWTLNKNGLLMLYRVITASMAIHSGASSWSGSSRSSSSSSSDFRHMMPYSPSSSSWSSKSPGSSPTWHARVGADVRGADARVLALPQPLLGTSMSSPGTPPARPLMAYGPRGRAPDYMPPPSGPIPPSFSGPLDSPLSSSFRMYRPRPAQATAPLFSAQPAPPRAPRPPRFHQPPQN